MVVVVVVAVGRELHTHTHTHTLACWDREAVMYRGAGLIKHASFADEVWMQKWAVLL